MRQRTTMYEHLTLSEFMRKLSILIAFSFFSALLGGSALRAQTSEPEVKNALTKIELGNPSEAASAMNALIAQSPKDADAHAALALAELALEDLPNAEKEAQAAVDLERKSILARVARASVYGKEGKKEDAVKEFTQAIKLNDKDIGTYLAFSRYYLSIDSEKSAEVLLYRAQAMNDKDVRSYIGLAELYEKQRIKQLAIDQYESAKKLDPNDVIVRAHLADLYRRNRQYEKSINEWIALVKVDSTYKPAYYQIASIFYLAGQYPNAALFAKKYVTLMPNDILGNWLAAEALTKTNQYTDALPYLEKANQNDSLKALSQLLLAQSYYYSKEFSKANALYQAAPKLSAEDQYFYGRSLFYSGDTTHAIDQLKQSIASNDTTRTQADRDEAMNFLTSILQISHRYSDAGDVFAGEAKNHPKAELYSLAGQMYLMAGKKDTAITFYQQAIKLDSNALGSYIGLGTAYLQKDPTAPEMKAAFAKGADLAKAQNNKESLGAAEWGLGQSDFYAKDYEAATKHFSEALAALPDNSPYLNSTLFSMAAAYQSASDYTNAKEYYKKLLARDPSNAAAKDQLDKIDQYLKSKGKGK